VDGTRWNKKDALKKRNIKEKEKGLGHHKRNKN